MSALDSTGYQITSLDDTFAALVALMTNIWGPSINVDPNSYDGLTLGIFAESLNNLDQLGQKVFNSFNPNTANGNALSTIVQLNYLTRQPGAYSSVTLTLSGVPTTPVPAGSLFQSTDGSNTIWATTADAVIDGTGTIAVQAQTQVYGLFTAAINSITKPLTPIYGLNSVTNLATASPGQLEETDQSLRIRRAGSTAANGQGPVDALRGALLQTAGVTAAQVYENYNQTADANGQPGNSIYCVVVGGDNQSIWDTIWFKRTACARPIGAVSGTVFDTAGWPHTLCFDRPAPVPIYIIANVKRRTGFPANGDTLIKNALVAWAQANLSIGDDVIQSELYAPAMAAVNNTGSVLSLYIGLAASPTTTTDLVIAYNAVAEFDPSFITVNLS